MTLRESPLDPTRATFDTVLEAGRGFTYELRQGQVFRIVDLYGNQAVDSLFYDLDDYTNRYSAVDTVRRQGSLYLTTGSKLLSTRGDPLLTVVADTCGRHDTIGGACSTESNQMRYGLEKRFMHACRQSFLLALAEYGHGLGKRDLTHNINFFMNVPVTPAGELAFADGISGPGRYVELRAERDVLVLISNCPQLNNPCNAYDPTPVRLLAWDP